MEALKKLYYDPSEGFLSAEKLYEKAIDMGIDIKRKDVEKFVRKQPGSETTVEKRKPKYFSSIYVDAVRDEYQIDIMVYNRYQFNKYKYILMVIDVHSRYLQVEPLTSRYLSKIVEALDNICKRMGYPKVISCDNEFNKNLIYEFGRKHDVEFKFSDPEDIQKNSIVERVNRTIAGLLQKWRTATKNRDWVKVLPDIIKNYNNTKHRTIKAIPEKVFNGKAKNRQDIKIVLMWEIS